jgi:hypothetical protein
VRLEGPGRNIGTEAPHIAEQLLAREHPIGSGCELDEKGELLRRQLHLLRVHRDAPRRAVDRERADLRELDARRAAPQERVDPRQQLLVDERTRKTVVGAGQRAHAGRRIRAAQHDHGTVGHDASVERIGVPEHEDVRIRGARQLLRALARDDVEAVVAQLALEEAAYGRFRLGEEKRGHAPRLGAPIRLRQMSFRAKA